MRPGSLNDVIRGQDFAVANSSMAVWTGAALAPDETIILLTPPVPLVGVSIGINRVCHQNDSLADN